MGHSTYLGINIFINEVDKLLNLLDDSLKLCGFHMNDTKEDNQTLKKTPLYEMHLKLGGKMVPFAGWSMPVLYKEMGVLKEHEEVRTNAGIFDICHMGEFLIVGKDAIPFMQYLMTNDLGVLENNKSQYSCMCYENGTVVDDLIYYQENPERIRLIVNGANVEKDFEWIKNNIVDFQVSLTNLSGERARFAYQGPQAEKLLDPYVDTSLSKLKRFHFVGCNLFNTPNEVGNSPEAESIPIFLTRTGYTGENGYEISCPIDKAVPVFQILLDTGAKPIGLGARDSLRLEASYSLYGHELSDKITPIEASIGWVVKPKEGIEYIGKKVLLAQKKDGTARKIVGITLTDRGIIRNDCTISLDGQEIGYVTSGGFAPTLKKTIALGIIKREFAEIGTKCQIQIRKKLLNAEIIKTPFYSP
jgi:glycine cleavage system T protein (aminomethyltransferase)